MKTHLQLNIEFESDVRTSAEPLIIENVVAGIADFLHDNGTEVGAKINILSYSAFVEVEKAATTKKTGKKSCKPRR